jgi:hypothetical protein
LKKKKKKKREEEWQERYERDESSERKIIIKCKEGCYVVERRNFHSFSNHVQADNEDVIGTS